MSSGHNITVTEPTNEFDYSLPLQGLRETLPDQTELGRGMKRTTLFVGLLAMSHLMTAEAEAQMSRSQRAQYCAQLEGQLAKLQFSKPSRSNRNFAKLDAAVHKQQAQIDSAMRRAKRDNCTGGGFFRRSPKATCPALMKRIDKMRRNLATLQKKRGRYNAPVSARDNRRRKAEIVRKLSQARCGEQYEVAANTIRTRTRPRGLFGAIFGGGVVRELSPQPLDIPSVGTYRTVCVRSCDGYFFPVSFSTTQGNFARDADVCRASCPGTDVELYTYRNPGETTDDMISLTGVPYARLEVAYRYQKEYVKDCSCQAPKSQMASLTNSDLPRSQARTDISLKPSPQQLTGPIVPLPMPRHKVIVDPDTQEAARQGLAFEPYRPPEISADKKQIRTADGRSIRIVGPKFFGSQE